MMMAKGKEITLPMSCLKVSLLVVLKYSTNEGTKPIFYLGSDVEDDGKERRDKDRGRKEAEEDITEEKYSDEEEDDEEDIGDFIVDAEGRPIHGKRKKKKAIYNDA